MYSANNGHTFGSSGLPLPFPFTGSDRSVRHPAAVLSRRAFNAEGHTVMAMITDARNQPWPLDIHIDHQSAGLKMPSVVRMKFFTLDNRLIIRSLGQLCRQDRQQVLDSLRQLLPPLSPPNR
jgi:mRNA interferase MazF